MPTPTATQFWDLLAASRLLDPAQLHALRQSHATLPNAAADDAKAVATWLIQRGAITLWQARRLVAGKAGPFFVGDYRLLDQRPADGEAGLFTARHEPSGRTVGLVMLNARRCDDPAVWTEIVTRTAAAARMADPVLSRTWALEQAGANRFIVCEPVAGESLAAELARRGPLPPAEAGRLALTVARALAELHAAGVVHGGLSLEAVLREPPQADGSPGGLRLLQFPLVGDPHGVPLRPLIDTPEQVERLGQRAAFVAPELTLPGATCDMRSDVYALGCLVHAAVTGKPPCWKGSPRATLLEASAVGPAPLAPPAVPVELATLIGYLTARDPAARYPSAGEAADAIAACLGLAPAAGGIAAEPDIEPQSASAWPDVGGGPVIAELRPTRQPPRRRRGSGFGTAAAVMLATAVVAGGGYYALSLPSGGGRKPKPLPAESSGADQPAAPNPGVGGDGGPRADASDRAAAAAAPAADAGAEPAAAAEPPAAALRGPAVQVVDDPGLPWQSPTSGPPPALAYLPPNAQWLLLARLADLLADDEGRRFLEALGPGVGAAVDGAAALAGCEPAAIEMLQAGWLAPSPDEVVMGLVIRLVPTQTLPADVAARRRLWQATDGREIDGEEVMVGGGRAFWVPPGESDCVLVVAPPPLMEEIIADAHAAADRRSDEGPTVSLDRDLETLVAVLDADRHLTLGGLPHHLLTNGRAAVPRPLARLLGPLDAFCGEAVKAAAISLHFGTDCYAEIDAVTTLDVPPAKAAPLLAEKLMSLPDDVEAHCVASASDPYGGRLVMRLPAMLRSLVANLRSGAERDVVVINAVLPRHAGHNIALAGEIALAQSPGAAPVAAAAKAAAEPTDALGRLRKQMTLTFARDTLEKTIQMISDETGVPMEIVGPDLQLEGITKNQSFALDEQDKPAEQILRAVLQKANPDGKLVYVVTTQDGAEMILITTRAAVEKRGDRLPPGF